jgi:hypothetical protein
MNDKTATWIVTVESFEGLTASVEVLELVGVALDADPTALGPAASLDTEQGVLSATFSVQAHSQGRAAELAIACFYNALAAAGFDVERPGWRLKLEIAPAASEAVPA